MSFFKYSPPEMKKLCIYRYLSLLLIPVAFLIKWLMSLDPVFTEKYYSRKIYPFIMQPISRFTGLFPFSVAEIAVILIVFYFIYQLVSAIIKSIRRRKWVFIINFLSKAAFAASIYIFLQTILWGINYERITFAENAGIIVEKYSVDELEELCKELINNANSMREKVTEDENGIMCVDGGFKSLARRAHLGYEEAQKKYPFLSGKYGKPKPVILSKLMSHSNIIGIYTGITGEANIDTDIPDMELPSTIMHELAHQRGFANEDEANFIAYVTCLHHPDIDFQYSGTILALQYSMNALYRTESERYFKLIEFYSPKLLNDFMDQKKYWDQYQGTIKKVANSINDTFLKINGVKDGVQSYGRMVDLLLAEARSNSQ
ncbi:MAG: DUF3810 domain-containing protein [Clostridiaceae bacterium]|nr:DUF3810 domain-containing protein [Clostridiaceae bacterium]